MAALHAYTQVIRRHPGTVIPVLDANGKIERVTTSKETDAELVMGFSTWDAGMELVIQPDGWLEVWSLGAGRTPARRLLQRINMRAEGAQTDRREYEPGVAKKSYDGYLPEVVSLEEWYADLNDKADAELAKLRAREAERSAQA